MTFQWISFQVMKYLSLKTEFFKFNYEQLLNNKNEWMKITQTEAVAWNFINFFVFRIF